MALFEFKTTQQIADEMKNDIKNKLPQSDPFYDKDVFSIIITSLARRTKEVYNYVNNIVLSILPTTASYENMLNIWGKIFNILPIIPKIATGKIIFIGTGTVPIDTEVQDNSGLLYITQNEAVCFEKIINIATLTQTSGEATATTSNPHSLATNMTIIIEGANETEYNGQKVITVISATQFKYSVPLSTPSTATGTIFAKSNFGTATVVAEQYGTDYNKAGSTTLELTAIVSGIDDTVHVEWNGIYGGTDEEPEGEYVLRCRDEIQNPTPYLSENFFKQQVKYILPTITRVWIESITPAIGKFTIYAIKDNSENRILTNDEIINIKNELKKFLPPFFDIDNSLILLSPELQEISFILENVFPDNQYMKNAIENNLKQFFLDESNVGEDISLNKLLAIIGNTFDPIMAEQLSSFTLTSPNANISVADGKLATFKDITITIAP